MSVFARTIPMNLVFRSGRSTRDRAYPRHFQPTPPRSDHPSTRCSFRSYSSSKANFRFGFKEAIGGINLKWTFPISLALGAGLWFYLQNQISSGEGSYQDGKTYQSNEPLPPLIVLDQPASEPILDPSTQIGFPPQLESDQLKQTEPMRLVGLGVRTVSFLAVKVYVAGLYVDPRVLRALRVVPGWETQLNRNTFLSKLGTGQESLKNDRAEIRGESLFRNLFNAPVNFAIRIVTVRPTDFSHLRDGFCRSLLARVQLAAKQGRLSEAEIERASQSINTFRTFFPTGVSVPKGGSLSLLRSAKGSLIVEYEGKKLGELEDAVVAKELFLAYFAEQDPISPTFKESVADGFVRLYST